MTMEICAIDFKFYLELLVFKMGGSDFLCRLTFIPLSSIQQSKSWAALVNIMVLAW
jgi:hypothetical protein